MKLLCVRPWFFTCKARFKRRATAFIRHFNLNDWWSVKFPLTRIMHILCDINNTFTYLRVGLIKLDLFI